MTETLLQCNLPHYDLTKPIRITIELDDNEYLAQTVDLPLYAFDPNKCNALWNLCLEIEDLYVEVMDFEDDELSGEFMRHKAFLAEHIGDRNKLRNH